jgi:hypothetical protein
VSVCVFNGILPDLPPSLHDGGLGCECVRFPRLMNSTATGSSTTVSMA